ncbi:DUF2783 domain-containing protein [uncultured Sulfitobacter sp.]|uniref:DUF2783 domain-containing protein n=1 Tax=uncultured Sulfitobacter sp. TaxID=191468 RepID=UPI002605DF4C|nr:DUF2783 domain-containing protein [uncultured Sulfitobacter sp.]
MTLTLDPNIADPDGFYDELLRAHEGLSKDESDAFNARLILVLCNHIGDRDVLRAALEAAK